MLYAHEHLKARPTLDIDFLGQQISRELDNIKETFKKLCDIECLEDGVVFDKDSISVEEITLKKNIMVCEYMSRLDLIRQAKLFPWM